MIDINKLITESLSNENNDKSTMVVSAFPACGKTHLFNNKPEDLTILDSDSSKFDKTEFPANYIEHIKNNIGKVDIILVSSHKDVRDALVDNNIEFTLVYPNKDLKDEYIKRYKQRGSSDKFIELVSKNWDMWTDECANQSGCEHIELGEGEFLSDVLLNK